MPDHPPEGRDTPAATIGKTRFAARNNYTLRTDEIALNPDTFVGRNDKEILSTLVHEMCHLWQAHEGKPGRGGYHNRQWAGKMCEAGLQPIEFNKYGEKTGKMTGQHVSHEIIPGGPFDVAADRLLATGFRLKWQSALSMPLGDNTPAMLEPKKRNKVKYSCPICEQNAWAKPAARLVCGRCDEPMIERTRD